MQGGQIVARALQFCHAENARVALHIRLAVKNEQVILGSGEGSNSNGIAPQYLGGDVCRVIAFVEDDNSSLVGYTS
jgi:hypothetical protein